MKQVTAAVIREDGRILLTRRAPNCAVPGAWELPGGKIESGETPQECLERELAEELRMAGTAGAILATTVHHYEHGSFELHAIEFVRTSDFEVQEGIHDEFGWFEPSQLSDLYLAPADVDLVTTLFGGL